VARPAAVCCAAALCSAALISPSSARAEFLVLRSGQRLHVTGYQLIGDRYHLQLAGGSAEIAASEVMGVEPEEIFTAQRPPVVVPRVAAAKAQAPFRGFMEQSAARYGVDPDLIASIIAAESKFNPNAVSRRDARGLMQLMPATAARLGVRNVFDPRENIDAGTRYLRDLLVRYNNDLSLALAAYNAGPDKVEQYGRVVPPYRETISYVRRVQRSYARAKANSRVTLAGASSSSAAPAANSGARIADTAGL